MQGEREQPPSFGRDCMSAPDNLRDVLRPRGHVYCDDVARVLAASFLPDST